MSRSYLKEWEYSAEILITHYRSVLRGQIPFLQAPGEATESYARANLDFHSLAYVQKVAALAGDQSE